MKKIYTKYEDPGHGWLKTKRSELHRLEITKDITGFSYQKGEDVFLEEDNDLDTFWNAKEKIDGVTIQCKVYHTNRDSKIRNYMSYNPDL